MKKVQENSGTNGRLLFVFRILLCVLLSLLLALLILEIKNLGVLSTVWVIILAIVFVFIAVLFFYLLCFRLRTRNARISLCLVAAVLCTAIAGGSYYLSKTNRFLTRITQNDETMTSIVQAYVLNDSEITSQNDLQGKKVGILRSINRTGTDKLLDSLSQAGISVESVEYVNFGPLCDALLNHEVDAIVIGDQYIPTVTDIDQFQNFFNEVRSVYSFTYTTEMKTSTKTVSSISTEPFTVMLNGTDSRNKLTDTDRSDVNMLATINPTTHVVLLVSIPRDSYVMTVCDPEYDCQNGQYDKLTHTGMHSYNTTKSTLENLMDIDINYTFRANFTSLIDIVNAMDGVDVYVEPGYAVESFNSRTDRGVTEGWNHLDGFGALAYARERKAYTEGDFQRIKNQQQVLTAIAKKVASPEIVTRYGSLLDAITDNIWTDFSRTEITDFAQFLIEEMPEWTFISYSLSGEPDMLYCAEAYNNASVVVLDLNTVRFANQLIAAVKNGRSAQELEAMIASFNPGEPDYGDVRDNQSVPEEYVDTQNTYPPAVVVEPQQPVIQDPGTSTDPNNSYYPYDPNYPYYPGTGTGTGTYDPYYPGTGGGTYDPGTGGGTYDPGTGGTTTDPGTGTTPGTGGDTTDPGTGTGGGSGSGTTDPGTAGGVVDPGTGGGTTDPGAAAGVLDQAAQNSTEAAENSLSNQQ